MFDKRTSQQESAERGGGMGGDCGTLWYKYINSEEKRSIFMRHSYKTTELCPSKWRPRPTSLRLHPRVSGSLGTGEEFGLGASPST